MPGINVGKLKAINVICPPLTEQREFSRRLKGVDDTRAAHRENLSKLDSLFASLQHRAFRGEL